eukprot:gb/GEZN01008191.1/.p1 GENE.gb/GEZN01008191.1/~~gb/GEZN01008191.1/.p1  ORF type:complete len:304 (+),score=57.47 gb/GEZN01008191.1/:42-914(+)
MGICCGVDVHKKLNEMEAGMEIEPMDKGVLNVTVISATDLKRADITGGADPYVIINMGKQEFKTTIKKGLKPEWNEKHRFDIGENDHFVRITMLDKDMVGKHDLLGAISLNMSDFKDQKEHIEDWQLTIGNEKQKVEKTAKLKMSIKYTTLERLNTIKVGGIYTETDKLKLMETFQPYGTIRRCLVDHTLDEKTNDGYVEFASEVSKIKALGFKGKIDHIEVKVTDAEVSVREQRVVIKERDKVKLDENIVEKVIIGPEQLKVKMQAPASITGPSSASVQASYGGQMGHG